MRLRLPVLLALLLPAPGADAYDVLYTRKNEKLEGTILSEDDKEVRFNPYYSSLEKVQWEVLTIPRGDIVKIDKVEDPLQTFWGRLAKLAPDDVKGGLELAKWAADRKLEIEKTRAAAFVLAKEPENAEALAFLSEKEKKELQRTDPLVNRTLAERIKAYAEILPKADRKPEYEAMKKDLGLAEPHVYYERIARSARQPKGYREDVKLTLLSEKYTGVYSISVPGDYDPARAWPLVIGLHGGGPDGADGKGVVGSGKEFMPFIRGECETRGCIAVCPSARAAPWSAQENDGFFLAVIREAELLYHVDLNRVYLIGHSMGGFGAWHFGPKYCDQFAVVAPASGGGNNGEAKMSQTHTAVYIYHSNNDLRCRVDPDRNAAKILKKTKGADFIYTELPNRDHDFPREVITDMLDFFERHRGWEPAGPKKARPGRTPRSSFLEKLTNEELAAFPFPDEASAKSNTSDRSDLVRLLETLIKGGGNAEKAAKELAGLKDPASVPMLGKALTQKDLANADGRAQAAWALGEIGHAGGVKFLVAALKDKDQPVRTKSVEALGKIADAKTLPPALQALKDLAVRFDQKTQGKQMDLTDWDALMADLSVYARALGRFQEPKSAADLRQQGVTKMLLAPIEVRYDKEVESGPGKSKRAAAEALIEGFEAIGGPDSAAALEDIAKGMDKDMQDVADKAREAARRIGA